MRYADGARIQTTEPIRRYRVDRDPEELPAGSPGTVIRGDMFGGTLVRVELDADRQDGITRLIEATKLTPLATRLVAGPNGFYTEEEAQS